MTCVTPNANTLQERIQYIERTLFSAADETLFSEVMTELANMQELDHKVFIIDNLPLSGYSAMYLIAPNAPANLSRHPQVYPTVEQMVSAINGVEDFEDFVWYTQNGFNIISMDALKNVYSMMIDVAQKKPAGLLTAYTLLSEESDDTISAAGSFSRYCLERCLKLDEGNPEPTTA